MNRKNKVMEVYGLWFADLLSICISFLLATYIRFGNFKDMGDKGIHFQVCLLFILFCTVYNFFLDWNRNFLKRSVWREIKEIVQYHVLMLLVVQTVMYFLKWGDVFSRLVMVLFPLINIALTFGIHMLIKKGMKLHFQSDLSQIKVLVITGQEMADSVLERLKENLDISYRIVGVACPEYEEGVTGQIRGVPIVGMGQHFMEELTQMALDEVFLYAPELRQKQIQEILNGLDEMGVDSHYCLELPGTHSSTGTINDFGSYFVLTYTRFKSSYKRLLLKRLMDIAGGLVGLLITLLFFPFVAIAIKLDSPGPVLFSQMRIGRNGRRFKIYKFRSMSVEAEEKRP